MRIGIDLRPLMGGKTSGVEVYIKSMLEALFRIDTKNRYVLWVNSFKKVSVPDFHEFYPRVQLRHTRIPNKLLNLGLSLIRFPKIDRLMGGDLDACWIPDPRPAPVSKGVKKVMTFHDLSFEDFRHAFNLKTRLWHKLLSPKREALESDALVAVSRFTKQRLTEEYQIQPTRIHVIYEAATAHLKPLHLPKGFEIIQRKYRLPKSYFLCLSTLEPRKNIAGIIEAYLKWQEDTKADVNLVIAGEKHPEIFSKYHLKPHPRIQMIGFVDESDKALLYEYALGFLYPSFYEGFGLPILEAMQCGAPVITSDVTGMKEVAGEAALLINPNDLPQLKNALHTLYRDGVLRKGLIKKGFIRASEFSWKKAAQELLNLFQHL